MEMEMGMGTEVLCSIHLHTTTLFIIVLVNTR